MAACIVLGCLLVFRLECRAGQEAEIAGQIIIQYDANIIDLENRSDRLEAIALEKDYNLRKIDELRDENMRLVRAGDGTALIIEQLKKEEGITIAESNNQRSHFATPNDSSWIYMWGLHNNGQSVIGSPGNADADMDVPEGWDSSGGISKTDTLVAVIDTGVRYDHQDLVANMWNGASCRDENGSSIPGGCPFHGWDYASQDNNPMDEGDSSGNAQGHGTHIAGIIGAVANNSYGMTGLSYDNRNKIMAIRFAFDTFSEVKAINFAHQNGAKIINASYGGYEFSQLEKNAIETFPGIFIAAAGNGGSDHSGDNNDLAPLFPCSHNSPNIICVAATDQKDALTAYSNYGLNAVDVGAPGHLVYSAYPSAGSPTSSFAFMNGTSMAAPQVAGVAAVLLSLMPQSSASSVKKLVIHSGDRVSSLLGKINSEKRINLANAVAARDDHEPPIAVNGSPLGVISTINVPAYLSIETNEPATCRYSNDDIGYEQMTSIFSDTGNTAHSSLLSGLLPGQSYNYYIKCADKAGNYTVDDIIISFMTSASFVSYSPPAVQADAPKITTRVKNRIKVLSSGQTAVTRKNELLFIGEASDLGGGKVRIYQGRRNYAFRKQTVINNDNTWRTKVKTKRGGYFFKFMYLDESNQQKKLDGPFYIKIKPSG